jgi:hypothetical protein
MMIMERVKQFKVSGRAIYARRVQGRVTGFQINIPASFSGMIDPDKKYTITVEEE